MSNLSRQITVILFSLVLSPQLFAQFGLAPENPFAKMIQGLMSTSSANINVAGNAIAKIAKESGTTEAVSIACVINDQIAIELSSIESALFYYNFDHVTCVPLATALDAIAKTMKKCGKIFLEGLQPQSMEILEDVSKAAALSKEIFTNCKLIPLQ